MRKFLGVAALLVTTMAPSRVHAEDATFCGAVATIGSCSATVAKYRAKALTAAKAHDNGRACAAGIKGNAAQFLLAGLENNLAMMEKSQGLFKVLAVSCPEPYASNASEMYDLGQKALDAAAQ